MSSIDDLLNELKEATAKAGHYAADVEALDEQRRITHSRGVWSSNESVAKAEHASRASLDYEAIVTQLNAARHKLADARSQADYLEKRYETWRTRMASARTNR